MRRPGMLVAPGLAIDAIALSECSSDADSGAGATTVQETGPYDTGFVAFWLPRDIIGTIEMSYDDKTGTMPFATGVDSPTCVTTLQLVG